MNMFTYKDTQITKFVETRELPRRPMIIPISVPMCIHCITVIANKYDTLLAKKVVAPRDDVSFL